MAYFSSCKQAIEYCLKSKTFSVARLGKTEKTMDMHIHDCYEIYFSILGGQQFLIDNRVYKINPGDLFLINQYESHSITALDQSNYERIVINIHPDFAGKISTLQTDLRRCFTDRNLGLGHKISLNAEYQERFLSLVERIDCAQGFGKDIKEQIAITELLVMINGLYFDYHIETEKPNGGRCVEEIINYINENISQIISVQELSDHFFLSKSYLCRIFKRSTGTTISKYIIARRITIAKALLNSGCSVTQAYEGSGFTDYSNFFKAFNKAVGMSPKKYAIMADQRNNRKESDLVSRD